MTVKEFPLMKDVEPGVLERKMRGFRTLSTRRLLLLAAVVTSMVLLAAAQTVSAADILGPRMGMGARADKLT